MNLVGDGLRGIEVRVDMKVHPDINRAYLVFVALDENEHPVPVPQLILETEEERQEWEAGAKRHALRKQRRLENY